VRLHGGAAALDRERLPRRRRVLVRFDLFARWHLGEVEWATALRCGAIEVRGSRTLARELPTWHRDHEHGPRPLHSGDNGAVTGAAAQGRR
jgi:hypothetical protein